MKSTKEVTRTCYKTLLFFLVFLCATTLIVIIYFYFYFGDKCLDVGGVWDSNQQKCLYNKTRAINEKY